MIGSGSALGIETCVNAQPERDVSTRQDASSLTIFVKGDNWGDGKPEDIHRLLHNVASYFTSHLREFRSVTIDIRSDVTRLPVILWRAPGQTVYTICLSTSDTKWAQYSYQFAHEFCHLISGYERLRHSRNKWFHESLCEAASLFALRSMGETWAENPPYANWSSYAESLTAYAEEMDQKVGPRVIGHGAFPAWLRTHEDQGRDNAELREPNRIVALRVLPEFQRYPTGWNALRSLPASDEPIERYLARWKAEAHVSDRAFITRIEGALGTGGLQNLD